MSNRRLWTAAWSVARRTAAKVVAVAVVLWAVCTWIFGVATVQGNGMEPTAGDGDIAFFYRLVGELEADDVVVYESDSGQQVGRVVALPGDTVEVTDEGLLLVNGTTQPSLTGEATLPGNSGIEYPLVLGENEYFVLGDGRTQAVDSREVGVLAIGEVQGKVVALLRLRSI